MAEMFEKGSANDSSVLIRKEIESLPITYAYATDYFGRATDTLGDQSLDSAINLDNPLFAEGLSLYREIFSKEFCFTLLVEGRLIEMIPNPYNKREVTDAVLEWANYVNNAFRKGPYKSTQHHIGSINSSLSENTAIVKSYLMATHVYSDEAADSGVSVTWGTYTDEVLLEDGSWLIKNRSLDVISTNTVSEVSKLAVE